MIEVITPSEIGDSPADDQRSDKLRALMGLITAAEVADLIGVSTHTLKMWRLHNKGPAYTKLGRQIFYRLSHINAWVSANTRTHDQEAVIG